MQEVRKLLKGRDMGLGQVVAIIVGWGALRAVTSQGLNPQSLGVNELHNTAG